MDTRDSFSGSEATAAWTQLRFAGNVVQLCYNVIKGTEYFVSLQTSVVITEECNVMVNSDELIGTTEYLSL
jgi:hypothetical protein